VSEPLRDSRLIRVEDVIGEEDIEVYMPALLPPELEDVEDLLPALLDCEEDVRGSET